MKAKFPDALEATYLDRTGAAWAQVKREHIVTVCQFLKNDLDFKVFISMDGVDRQLLPESTPRFEVVYFFKSLSRNEHARLKVLVSEDDANIPTIIPVFQGAAWSERLVWDFYGVKFAGHANLRRMFMYEEFEGHPLRKDYPLRGRQPLIPERPIKDIFRGPGTNGVA